MKYTLIIVLLMQSLFVSQQITITFEGETLAKVKRSEYTSIFGEEHWDRAKFHQLAEEINEKIKKAPINAFIDEYGAIVAEERGLKLDRAKFTEAFHAAFFQSTSSTIEVPTIPLYPKVDSELLASIRVKQIGQYTTYFNPRKKARVQNISLAVDAINNHVVFPGEEFSFNEVVGQRTLEKGYLPAPIYIKGKIYEDFGGGICQVSSTLFNAVDLAGMKIKQRYSHSRRVPYVPPGRDAQVSWYGADFRFKNNYNQPILIRAKVYRNSLTIFVDSSDVINVKNEKTNRNQVNPLLH